MESYPFLKAGIHIDQGNRKGSFLLNSKIALLGKGKIYRTTPLLNERMKYQYPIWEKSDREIFRFTIQSFRITKNFDRSIFKAGIIPLKISAISLSQSIGGIGISFKNLVKLPLEINSYYGFFQNNIENSTGG